MWLIEARYFTWLGAIMVLISEKDESDGSEA